MITYACKICETKIHRPTNDSLCSNLLRHASTCLNKQREGELSRNLATFGVTGTGDIDPQEVQQLCEIWCANAARPFSALADKSLKAILHPTVVKYMPSDKVILRSVHMLYTAVQHSYRKELTKHKGAMYIGADAWQSPNGFDILGVVLYRMVKLGGGKFDLEAMPLDFVQLARSHTGEYLADTVRTVVEKFGIQDKICGIVTDNASNNSVMVSEMKKIKWARFKGDQQWIWCYAHILNLIVQSILRLFGTAKKRSAENADEGDVDSLYSSDESGEEDDPEQQIRRYKEDLTHLVDEEEIETAGAAFLEDVEPELTLEDLNDLSDEDEDSDIYTTEICRETLAKFRAIARKLCKSPNSKIQFAELCKDMGCESPHSIVQDVCTRWNSTLDQSVGIVRCKKAILIWQKDKKHGLDRKYHINSVDIQLANHLVEILQVFYDQTLQVSTRGSARLTHVIVFINEITKMLSNLTNKYYTLTNCLPLFRIAMVLHPSFKIEYFKIAGWEEDWINKALRLTQDMFNTHYKPLPKVPVSSDPHKATKPRTGNIAQLGASLAARGSSTDPIDMWLASGLILDEGSPIDPLNWWINQLVHSTGGSSKKTLVIHTVGFRRWLLTS
ncbi:hypothetical protein PTTG_25340 [Puccinia triticina 1-1 BBBD Race 1]|uniref:DUF659 domain-containing protein n=1 Tax=Puccinia triticina (isolate 1-1 / race 1 (BBBD)) TaxID=630390 RepID=A0A180H451_PUCT1|nr:hypothetical protein PTTG_25340 [Puccinia triticina 1-1 BBBD Race 1]